MKGREWKFADGGWAARSLGRRAGFPQSAAARRGSRTLHVLSWLLAVFGLALCASAQNYSIDWYKVSGGGGRSTGGVYSVSGIIGQPDAGGPMRGGNYSLTGGYWSLVAMVQTGGAPTLTVTRSGNSLILSWPYPSDGWTLQQNNTLSTTNWFSSGFTVSTNASANNITISEPLGNLFFRLVK